MSPISNSGWPGANTTARAVEARDESNGHFSAGVRPQLLAALAPRRGELSASAATRDGTHVASQCGAEAVASRASPAAEEGREVHRRAKADGCSSRTTLPSARTAVLQ